MDLFGASLTCKATEGDHMGSATTAIVSTKGPVAIALLLLSVSAQAFAQDLVFKQLDSRHGLSHNSVFVTMQDHQGFLWIGTNDGLNRYDGHRFLTFRHDPADSTSLSNNTVRRVWEDRRRTLWIRTEAGLDRLDRATRRFRHYPIQVVSLLEEHNGSILVAGSQGIYRYDVPADSFQRVVAFPLEISTRSPSDADPVWGFIKDRQGRLWVSTQEGRVFAVERNGSVQQLQSPWRYTMLHWEDDTGQLLIGHQQGVGTLDPRSRSFAPVPGTDAIRGRVISAYREPSGSVWFGGDELHRLDPAHANATRIPLDSGTARPLQVPIWTVMKDREGALWLSTPSGIRFSDPYAKSFNHHQHDARDSNSLSADPVMALTVDGAGALWAGTVSAGLNRIDLNTRDVQRMARRPGSPGFSCGDQVWALTALPDGEIWAGTDRGVCVLEAKSGRSSIRRLPSGIGGIQPLVFALIRDGLGNVWAGTTMGLFQIDPSSGTVREFKRVFEDRPGLVRIESLALDSDGAIWAGTSWSDLYRIAPSTGQITHFPVGNSGTLRGSEGFWEIEPRNDGHLWIASDRGLFLFSPADGTLQSIGRAAGAPGGPVYAIVTDKAGALWLSTADGIYRYPRPQQFADRLGDVRHYTATDGLPFSEFNRRAALLSPSGHLVFGGMGGIVHFDPATIRDNPHPPPVVFTAIERSRMDGPVAIEPFAIDSIAAAWDDTGIAFEFSALAFTNPTSARYRYRLEGVDPDWVTAGSERRARYPSLKPGSYTFRVRAANADGVSDSAGASLAIVVLPPWWATTWFRALFGLFSASILVGAVRYSATRKLHRRVRELEMEQQVHRERNRISRDLHDNVGSQVSTILAGIELVQMSSGAGDAPRLDGYLKALREDAERTMSELRETVWSLHHDRVSLSALVERIQEYLSARRRYLDRPTLTCVVDGDSTRELSSAHALHLYRIVQEAVSNAIRHAGGSTVTVTVNAVADHVRIAIHDDGTFRPPLEGHRGLGMDGMRSRAAEIGGTFTCEPSQQTGTLVTVELQRSVSDREA